MAAFEFSVSDCLDKKENWVTVHEPERCAHPVKKRCQTAPRAGRRGYEVLAGCESSAYVAVYT